MIFCHGLTASQRYLASHRSLEPPSAQPGHPAQIAISRPGKRHGQGGLPGGGLERLASYAAPRVCGVGWAILPMCGRGQMAYSRYMPGIVRPPCGELLNVAEVIDKAIAQYIAALRSVPQIGKWEAPQESYALGWLLIRNVEAVIELARVDEVSVTAAWSNARVAFEHSARIVWMLHPEDRYQAECRWLAFLEEGENNERKIARETPDYADDYIKRAETKRSVREGVISALPAGYRSVKLPSFRAMLIALGNPEMYRFYQEGSQYVHGTLFALASYRRNLGTRRDLGDFTSTADWISPMRLCWLSFRNAAMFILKRLEVPESQMPDLNAQNRLADAVLEALTFRAAQST
jgi:hypothetical protein